MKALLFILLFLNYSSYSQTNDTLSKYCYRVFNFSQSSFPVTGTASFIKKDSQYYIITAKHVLSGCIMSGTEIWKDKDYLDKIMVMGKDQLNQPVSVIIDISKIKDTAKCLPFLLDPDIISIPVSNPHNFSFNSIENFVYSPINKNGNIEIFGFPADSNFNKGRLNFDAPPGKLYWRSEDYDIFVPDSINNLILNKNQWIPNDSNLKGYSGSPVFFKNEKSSRWQIAGVFSGIITNSINQRIFVMPKINFDMLSKE